MVASQQGGEHALSSEQADAAAWTVWETARGTGAVGGARALALAIAVGRDVRWPLSLWRVPGLSFVADRVYSVVARYRYRLPGDTPWCVSNPDRCNTPAD